MTFCSENEVEILRLAFNEEWPRGNAPASFPSPSSHKSHKLFTIPLKLKLDPLKEIQAKKEWRKRKEMPLQKKDAPFSKRTRKSKFYFHALEEAIKFYNSKINFCSKKYPLINSELITAF